MSADETTFPSVISRASINFNHMTSLDHAYYVKNEEEFRKLYPTRNECPERPQPITMPSSYPCIVIEAGEFEGNTGSDYVVLVMFYDFETE